MTTEILIAEKHIDSTYKKAQKIIINDDLVNDIFNYWKNIIADDFDTYKNHVLRVLNYFSFLNNIEGEFKSKIIIAICHQRIGLFINKNDKSNNGFKDSLNALNRYLKSRKIATYYYQISDIMRKTNNYYHIKKTDPVHVMFLKKAYATDFSLGHFHHYPRDYIQAVSHNIPYLNFYSFVINSTVSDFMLIFKKEEQIY